MENYKNKKYSHFESNDVINNILPDRISELKNRAPDEKTRKIVESILYEGGFDDFSVNTDLGLKNSPELEAQKRLFFANLLLSDPKTFDVIVKNNIALFHGTNSNVLSEILKNGLRSEFATLKEGKKVVTGESSPEKPREFVSFTDKADVALAYATLAPLLQTKGKDSYGVILGMSLDDLNNRSNGISTYTIGSDYPELGIRYKLPKEFIRFIAAPQKHIKEVLKNVNKLGLKEINVVHAEGIVESAIEVSKDFETFMFTQDCLEIKEKRDYTKRFNTDDFKNVAETKERRTSKIRQIFDRLKNELAKIKGDKDEYSRN